MSSRSDDGEFYRGHGFDGLTGPGAAAVAELDARIEEIRGAEPLAGNLYEPRVRADFPGNACYLPINLMLYPDRQFDYVLLRGAPGEGFPIHVHGYGDEVYLVIGGRGIVTLDGVEHEAGPGDIFHIPAGTPHGYRVPEDAEETLDLFVVNVPGVDHRLRSKYWAAEPQEEGR